MMQILLLVVLAVLSVVANASGTAVGLTPSLKQATPKEFAVSQIHLAQGISPTSMMVMWVTRGAAATSCSYWSTGSADAVQTAEGKAEQYEQKAYHSGHLHSVMLTGLAPATTYTYQCGDKDKIDALSDKIEFTTMPAVGDLAAKNIFAVVGDLGTTSDSRITLQHCIDNKPDMMLHAGDLSYANCEQPIWDAYGEQVEALASRVPWMVGPGNHEIEIINPDGSDVYTAFEARYKMPAVKPPTFGNVTIAPSGDCTPSEFQSDYSWGNAFYSFEAGLGHFTYLNCYSLTDETSEQYAWAKKDFASVNRKLTPWLIVVMHCPWYNSNTAHQGEKQTLTMKKDMESIFYDAGVDIAFTGHVHAYERSHPVFQDQPNENGTTFVTIGDGGNKEGHAADYIHPQPAWSAYRDGLSYGHGILTLTDEAAEWEWNRNDDGTKVVTDSASLKKIGRRKVWVDNAELTAKYNNNQ